MATPFEGSEIDPLESEIDDTQSSLSGYEIVTYPADYTLEGLVRKWEKRQIEIPGFQRKYVWNMSQASKLVESFLLGLPVPALFLYVDPDSGVQQVIDGQQRLLSVVKYFGGVFSNSSTKTERVFKLSGLSKDSPYLGLSYEQLQSQQPVACARLDDTVLRAFVVKQLDPTDSTSIYHIFERLNTGGTTLMGQEIRNCVYHGDFNNLLSQLNEFPSWRKIYGKDEPDGRMRDIELILRCIALAKRSGDYQKPMKDFLSTTMRKMRNPSTAELAEIAENFTEFCELMISEIGNKPFHYPERLSASKLDAVFAVLYGVSELPTNFKDRFDGLLANPDFIVNSSKRTTDRDAVVERIGLARTSLLE